jgi:uncharacterized protein (DUF983 family)
MSVMASMTAIFHYDFDVGYVCGARESFEAFVMSVVPVILTVAGMSVMLTVTPGMSVKAFMIMMPVAVMALLIMNPLCP